MCCVSAPLPATAHMGRVPALFSHGTRNSARQEAEASINDLSVRVSVSLRGSTHGPPSVWPLSQEALGSHFGSAGGGSFPYLLCSLPFHSGPFSFPVELTPHSLWRIFSLCWWPPFPHCKMSFSRDWCLSAPHPRPGTEMVLGWYLGEQMNVANASPRPSKCWLFFVLKSELTWLMFFSESAERKVITPPTLGSLTLPEVPCLAPVPFTVHTFPLPLRCFTRKPQRGKPLDTEGFQSLRVQEQDGCLVFQSPWASREGVYSNSLRHPQEAVPEQSPGLRAVGECP